MAVYSSLNSVVHSFCMKGSSHKLNRQFASILIQGRSLTARCLKDQSALFKLHIQEKKKISPVLLPNNQRVVSNILRPNFQTSAAPLTLSTHCKFLHTTQPQKAIPPVLLLVLRPVLNVAAVVFGRLFKKLWRRLPQEKRDKIILRLKGNKRKIAGILGVLSLWLLMYIIIHIEEVPFTKRRRIILFSQKDMRNLCEEVENEMIKDYEAICLPSYHPHYSRTVRIMNQIMNANRKEITDSGVTVWRIYVIDTPEIRNAMVLPNGTVFVFSGILDTCSSDDQLGTVLAHEIAHVLLNHQGENLSKEHFFSMFSVLFITAIWAVLPDFAAFLSHVFASKTSDLFIRLPFSRLMESEADTVGLNIAAKACLDVREASVFWAKMALLEELGCEEQPLELLSSHPSHMTRQKAIDELIPEALLLRQSCKCHSLSSSDPRANFNLHKKHLLNAKSKGCLSCASVFSNYNI